MVEIYFEGVIEQLHSDIITNVIHLDMNYVNRSLTFICKCLMKFSYNEVVEKVYRRERNFIGLFNHGLYVAII